MKREKFIEDCLDNAILSLNRLIPLIYDFKSEEESKEDDSIYGSKNGKRTDLLRILSELQKAYNVTQKQTIPSDPEFFDKEMEPNDEY